MRTRDAGAMVAAAGWLLFVAVGISIVIAVVGTLLILKIVDVLIGVRVTKEDESEGLDISMHGEEGYNFEG